MIKIEKNLRDLIYECPSKNSIFSNKISHNPKLISPRSKNSIFLPSEFLIQFSHFFPLFQAQLQQILSQLAIAPF
jgi:hypothetical protein